MSRCRTDPEAIVLRCCGEIGRLQDVDLLDFLDGGPPDTPRLGVCSMADRRRVLASGRRYCRRAPDRANGYPPDGE